MCEKYKFVSDNWNIKFALANNAGVIIFIQTVFVSKNFFPFSFSMAVKRTLHFPVFTPDSYKHRIKKVDLSDSEMKESFRRLTNR